MVFVLAGCSVALAAACGLQEGSVIGIDPTGDAGQGDDGSQSTLDGDTGDATPPGNDATTDSGGDGGPTPRFIFATTSTAPYAFDVSTHVLRRLGTYVGCGLDGGYDAFDLAVDATRNLYVLPWISGQFWLYGVEPDGGCTDLHGGPGTNPSGSNMWVGFQKGSSDTLYAFVAGQSSLYSYNATGNYIATVSALPTDSAKADIACTSTLCYTALAHNKCPTDPGGSHDCLYSFQSNGTGGTQVGDFGVGNVVGIAYDSGSIYGFCSNGDIVQVSTTAPSTGQKLTDVTIAVGTVPTSWLGAASSSAN